MWECLSYANKKKKTTCIDSVCNITQEKHQKKKNKLKNSQTSSAIYIKYSCVLKKPKLNFELSC